MKMSKKKANDTRKARREFCTELAIVKNRAAQLGLWKTLHALDEGVKAVGWEVAELLSNPEKEFRGL